MNKALINESFRTLNEQEEQEKDYRKARNKIYSILEEFYERRVEDLLAGPTLDVDVDGIAKLVPEYDREWAKEDSEEDDTTDYMTLAEELITALVKTKLRQLFYNAN